VRVLLAADNVPDLVLWAPVVSAFLLLLSGLAAWRTAATTARSFRRSVMPSLDLTFLIPKPHGPLQLTVRNLGDGVAKTPCVILVARGLIVFEYVGDGVLRSGEGVKITATAIDAASLDTGEYMAMAGCRDLDNAFHAWSTDWEHRMFRDWRRRPVRTLDWGEAFQRFYPKVDPTRLPKMTRRIEPL
jgi:hypothetical protein